MPERKKILFLITKSNWGGAQRYVFDLATSLPQEQFEVIVALGGDGPLIQKLNNRGIRIVPIEELQRDVSLKKELRAFGAIRSILKAERPDILHINSSKAGVLGVLAGRLSAVPRIIFTAHGWAFNENRSFISKCAIKALHWLTVLFSHKTIAVSRTLKTQMNWPFVQKKMTVVHNGRTIKNMLPREEAQEELKHNYFPTVDFSRPVGVTVAELHPIKRHDITINAIAEVVKSHPEYLHIIIGRGDEEMHLLKLVEEFGLSKNIILGYEIPEVAPLLKAFDLFILSSDSEALAYVIIEASQAGLPIIATRVGGIPEIITDDTDGLLVPAGDSVALASALTRLLENTECRERLGRKALERGEHFTLSHMVNGTVDVYFG